MKTDLQVLTVQKIIDGHTWDQLKRKPDLMERYIKDNARQHLAAEIAEKRLAREVLSEPDPDSDDPMRRTNAVLRLTVAVAARDEAALLARELSEAEDRGFQRAIRDMKQNLERFAPRLGETAHTRGALDRLIQHVTAAWDHRPAADWRPMRTLPGDWHDVEFWFLTGDTGRTPRLRVPIRTGSPLPLGNTETLATVSVEEFEAIAWRYAGRRAHIERAA